MHTLCCVCVNLRFKTICTFMFFPAWVYIYIYIYMFARKPSLKISRLFISNHPPQKKRPCEKNKFNCLYFILFGFAIIISILVYLIKKGIFSLLLKWGGHWGNAQVSSTNISRCNWERERERVRKEKKRKKHIFQMGRRQEWLFQIFFFIQLKLFKKYF